MNVDNIEQLIYRWIANKAQGNLLVTDEEDKVLRDGFIHEVITRTLSKNSNEHIIFISNRDVRILDHKNVESILPIDVYNRVFWSAGLVIFDTYNLDRSSVILISQRFKAKWKIIISYIEDCISHQMSYPLLNYKAPVMNYKMMGVKLNGIILKQYNDYTDTIENIMNKFDVTDDEISTIKGIHNKFHLIAACNTGQGVKENGRVTPYPPQYFRKELAYLCGWNENLDTSIEVFRDIEDNYSPGAIGDAANACMRVMHSRKALLVNNDDKTNFIVDLITNNKNKSIIVYNESWNAYDNIAQKLNTLGIRNGNIHNYVKGTVLHDDNGHVIQTAKGDTKLFGKTGVRKHYIRQFNDCIINVLCIANKQPDTIPIQHCDLIILNGYNFDLDIILKSKLINFTANKTIEVIFLYNEGTNDYDKVKHNINKYKIPIRLKRGIIKK